MKIVLSVVAVLISALIGKLVDYWISAKLPSKPDKHQRYAVVVWIGCSVILIALINMVLDIQT